MTELSHVAIRCQCVSITLFHVCLSTADEHQDRLLIAERGKIDSLVLQEDGGPVNSIDATVDGVERPVAVDYDALQHRVIFTDTRQHWVASQLLNGSTSTLHPIDKVLSSPLGVAFDWISRLVFYSDFDYRVIIMCTASGHYIKPVLFTTPSKPGPLAVDPQNGLHICFSVSKSVVR